MQLDKLGEPAFIVVPNKFHVMDAACYKERYPAAKVLCPERDVDFYKEKLTCGVDGTAEDMLRGICDVHVPLGIKDKLIETDLLLPLQV